jgi:CRP-like cAMP-binding protein
MSTLLERIPIFAGLQPEALRLLASRAQFSKAATGSPIVKEGEPGNRFFLIESGDVRVVKGFGTPGEVELARLGPLSSFGEMCILETLPRAATVVAVTDTRLWSLESVSFLRLYEEQPKQYGLLLLNIARDLSRRLRNLDERFSARQ